MKMHLKIFIVLAAVLLFGGAVYMCYFRGKSERFQEDDHDDGDSDKPPSGVESGEAVFTFHSMSTCPHCKRFHEDFEKLKKEWSGEDVKFVVNSDTSKAAKQDIHSFPTLTLTMPSGEIETFSGTRSVPKIGEWMKEKLGLAKNK